MPELTEATRQKLAHQFATQVSILRQVVYKELQMWKRVYADQTQTWQSQAALTDKEKEFIDSQISWLMAGDIPDDILITLAKHTGQL